MKYNNKSNIEIEWTLNVETTQKRGSNVFCRSECCYYIERYPEVQNLKFSFSLSVF